MAPGDEESVGGGRLGARGGGGQAGREYSRVPCFATTGARFLERAGVRSNPNSNTPKRPRSVPSLNDAVECLRDGQEDTA